MDADAIEELARDGKLSEKSIRTAKRADAEVSRDVDQGRGLSSLQEAKYAMHLKEQLYMDRTLEVRMKLDRFNVSKEMLTVGGQYMTPAEKVHWFQRMSESAEIITRPPSDACIIRRRRPKTKPKLRDGCSK